ncbi:MAG: ABC transporter ATP-binding protein [Muribaculum sp.]|nr:ABC transporter ATP-binding protein [Muribaculum sp.]
MLKFDGVTYCYKGEIKALDNVNACIGAGIHLLVGENGAGKTTLLHVAAGLLRPQQGLCTYDGVATGVRSPHIMSRLFLLTDDPQFPANTINECVKCHAIFYPQFSREVLDDCLREFGLDGSERLDRLSLGNRKKALLAYCIALRTELLLLDEPANGLDIQSKKTLQRLLVRHIGDSQTVIVSTHTTADLHNLYSGLIVMHHSRLVLAMPVADIMSRLAFVVGPAKAPEALYSEMAADGVHSIVVADEMNETEIDFELLYCALCTTENSQAIISQLTK